MAWRLTGQLIESCSCNMFCPCWFLNPDVMIMDQGWCDSAIALRVAEGNSEGVNLGGRTVILGIDFPGPKMFDGNGTLRVYVDEGASADQVRELEAICQGKKGGPMGGLAPLIAKTLPTLKANISFKEDGDIISITVPGAGQLESKVLRDGDGKTFSLTGGGFVGGMGMEAAQLASSASRWADPTLPRQFETKSGARGNFTWSG